MSNSLLWAARVPLREGESLTSWITRLAYENAALPEDVRRAARIATKVNIDSSLYRADIRDKESCKLDTFFESRTGIAQSALRATLPSVVPGLGRFCRSKMLMLREGKEAYTRYCPDCLKQSGYLRLRWRLAFSSVCPTHRCQLSDICELCRSPVYTNALINPKVCPTCEGDLTQISMRPRTLVSDPAFYDFVDVFVHAATQGNSEGRLRKIRKDVGLYLYRGKFTGYIFNHASERLRLNYDALSRTGAITVALHWLFTLYGGTT